MLNRIISTVKVGAALATILLALMATAYVIGMFPETIKTVIVKTMSIIGIFTAAAVILILLGSHSGKED